MHLEIGDPANTPVIFGSSYGAANGILCVGVIEWLGNNTLDLSNCQFDGTIITRGTTEVSIVDTVGTYDLIRLPDSVPSRIRLLKGNLRVIGTATGTAPANYADIIGAQTGGAPAITSGGTDTDVDLLLGGQGAGVVKFGTHSNVSTETLTGFITIKDAAGNSRKLGVVS
jgi:hypothetical protein